MKLTDAQRCRVNRVWEVVAWPVVAGYFLVGRIVDPIVCWWANRSHLPMEGEL